MWIILQRRKKIVYRCSSAVRDLPLYRHVINFQPIADSDNVYRRTATARMYTADWKVLHDSRADFRFINRPACVVSKRE